MRDGCVSRKRRGRPALQDGAPSAALNLRVPAVLYDQIYIEASIRRISVADMVRQLLARGVSVTQNSDRVM